MRRLQQEAQQAALRSRQLEDQLSTLLQQAEADRATHNQQVGRGTTPCRPHGTGPLVCRTAPGDRIVRL